MESVNREALFLHGFNEGENGIITVLLQFRIVHGRALIPQCPFGEKGRAPGEKSVIIHNTAKGVTAQKKEINISSVCLPVGIAGPVIALFPAHVED